MRFPANLTRQERVLKHKPMKTRIRRTSLVKENTFTKTAPSVAPTPEEIRERAHKIFMARGGTHGSDLDDWLRAEQELKQERVITNAAATQ